MLNLTGHEENIYAFSKALAFHFVVILILWFSGIVISLNAPENLEVIRVKSAVKVDLVAMPELTLKELKNLPKVRESLGDTPEKVLPEKLKIEEENPNAPILNDPAQKESFDDFLNDLSKKKIDVKKNNPKAKLGASDGDKNVVQNEKIKELLHLGNKLSRGIVSFGEDESEGANEELLTYAGGLIEKIRGFWRLPSFLKDQNLQCGIQVFISPDGQLIRTVVREASTVPDYDNRAQNAILESAPFDPVPEAIQSAVAKGKIVIGFPL